MVLVVALGAYFVISVKNGLMNLIRILFHWEQFLVNISGWFLIGIFYALGERSNILSPQVRFLLITGLCGGYTTFSTFAFENFSLLRIGDMSTLLLYSLGSLVAGVVAVFMGSFLIKIL